jgi:hypothetical protein
LRATGAWSGGSELGTEVNLVGGPRDGRGRYRHHRRYLKPWTDEIVRAGRCRHHGLRGRPFFPGKRYIDWQLDDPAGQDLDAVRPIRDEIETRVRRLLAELGVQVDR